jgi:hypothetical protein
MTNIPSITIDDGVKRVCINGDPARVISFNPSDVVFAEKFYALMTDFRAKQIDYERRAKKLDEIAKTLDESGLPVNMSDGLAFLREICEYLRVKIDGLFGSGSSQIIFGDAMTLDMFAQFFAGITPFFENAREEKMLKYLNQKNAGRVMK